MLKDRYEISVWQDYEVSATDTAPAHYEEKKIAVIGSNTMTSENRAIEANISSNINGTNTLTFKLFYTYTNTQTGKKEKNPFISLLVNERKVKLFWKNKWYDFVIKNIQEDSSGKSITYTCSDQYINELSKTGFSLEFDNELQNNQGTVQELGKKILEGTDWQLGASDSQDTIQQKNEEPLYSLITKKSFTAKDSSTQSSITIPSGATILVFYSVVQERATNFQFIYEPNGFTNKTDTNSQLLVDVSNYFTDVVWVEDTTGDSAEARIGNSAIISIPNSQNVSDYRGERLVLSQVQEYDPLLKRYCYLYKENKTTDPQEIYGYTTTEYKDSTVVINLVNNASNFVDTNGWIGNDLVWTLYPPFTKDSGLDYSAKTYLKIYGEVFNTGLQNSSMYIEEGFQVGQQYIFRVKAYEDSSNRPNLSKQITTSVLAPIICDSYTEDGKTVRTRIAGSDYFTSASPTIKDGWLEYTLTCVKSIPRAKITTGEWDSTLKATRKIGLFLKATSSVWVEEAQLFPLVYGQEENEAGELVTTRINPGEMSKQSVAQVYYKYYYKNNGKISADDLEYLYSSTVDWSGDGAPVKVYPTKTLSDGSEVYSYEKIRSITGKNSNRFNLLQTLAETFQCWVRFEIQHDDTGKIIYKNGVPQKFVYFKNEVGEERGYGFVYGIDLQAINRSILSDNITSKVIVVPNTNEYAKNGVCEIAQSDFNESKENFILDFSYYISQGLLDSGTLNKDLYLNTTDSIGYYYWLKLWNSEYYALTEKLVSKKSELTKQESIKTVYEQYITSSQEQVSSIQSDLANWVGESTYDEDKILSYINSHSDNEKVKNLYTTLITTRTSLSDYMAQRADINSSVEFLQNAVSEIEERQKTLKELLENKHLEFYTKYSRFIQEGTWSSQDYLDENLYYLDAKGIAYTSARPQISYNISCLRLSALERFKGKVFNVGDISYIEDPEFFGYTFVNNIRTPYREKVLISQVSSYLDSPEKDSFTIQNYKTQFEDLFQRITSTTQSLQYSTGEYERASKSFEGTGVINSETLQNSIKINQDLVFSSQNDEVRQDSTGLTLTDKTNPSKKCKLTSGGLFISTDGGVTWKNAVRGEGIATQYLTAGAINVENITILNGDSPTFRWDKDGINAFSQIYDSQGNKLGINLQTFVRFDQYGIYGLRKSGSNGEEYHPTSEQQIWDDASFGMTWKGFFVKNKGTQGWVEVSSENDVSIFKTIDGTNIQKIKIGRLDDSENPVYGLRISDDTGATVMETDEKGQLWLRNKLSIGTTYTSNSVKLGSLGNEEEDYITRIDDDGKEVKISENGQRVFDANNTFVVFEDGTVRATDGVFSGTINATDGTFTGKIFATGGKIGGLEIRGVSDATYATIDSTGLTISNGAFSIVKKNYELTTDTTPTEGKTYYEKVGENYNAISDPTGKNPSDEGWYELKGTETLIGTDDEGNLQIKGNLNGASGTFTGSLEGATGSFSGELTALSGRIGGFIIEDGRLVSSDEESIILDGSNGQITANNILLGTGAVISDYIKLGNAYLYNPDKHDGEVLKSESIILKEDGTLYLGDIIAEGNTSTIKTPYWELNKDWASFRNISAQGGSIENVVFKKSTIQASSGLMIFKPALSGQIVERSSNSFIFLVEDITDLADNQFSIGDFILLSSYEIVPPVNGKITAISESTGRITLTLDNTIPVEENKTVSLTKIAHEENGRLSDHLLIGINPNLINQKIKTDSYLFRSGITFTVPEYNSTTGKLEYPETPNLFLGDLSSIGKSGYGLSGDNVYLKGTLTTRVPSTGGSTYAGVNTTSGVSSTIFSSNERIVFWAGSKSDEAQDIRNAPFQVTDNGNLYAKNGKFEGSVMTDSIIQGSDIYAVRIHGGTQEKIAPLTIYDTNSSETSNGGILFKTGYSNENGIIDEGTELFRISGAGFYSNNSCFIDIKDGVVNFSGQTFSGKEVKVNDTQYSISLTANSLSRNSIVDEQQRTLSKINLLDEGLSYQILNDIIFSIGKETSIFFTNTQLEKNVIFGDDNLKMEYKRDLAENGYDLYIYSNETTDTLAVAGKGVVGVAVAG